MLKRRLRSLFSARTAPPGDAGPAATPDSLAVTPDESAATDAETPKDGTDKQGESSPLVSLGIPVGSPDLLAEVQANAATAVAPRSGELSRFQTTVWDNSQLATASLSKWTRQNLNEAYIDIELANSLVWLSDVTGRVSKETAESYAKLCVSVSERLEAVLSQTAAETPTVSPREDSVAALASGQPEVVTTEAELAGAEKEAANAETQADMAESPADAPEEPPTDMVREGDETLFLGKTRLFVTRGANSGQIAALTRSLCETQGIRVISSGGSSKGRSTVTLSVDTPLPVLKLLRGIPLVKTASKEKTDIAVSLVTE